jgi:hypothetical protein
MNPTVQHYTAAQIAAGLGRNRRTLQRVLADVTPSGQLMVSGNLAYAWSLLALPAGIRAELEAKAVKENYRGAAQMLANPGAAWQPAVPLVDCAQHCLDKAAKLQRALRRVLELQADLTRSTAELEQIGLVDYAREFGHLITDRYLRELVKRTQDRAGAAGDFSSLELYLDEMPARKQAAKPIIPAKIQDEFCELGHLLQTFTNPLVPTGGETENFWLRAFELLDARIADGAQPKQTCLALRKYLIGKAGFLAKGPSALRVAFKRKYDRWSQSERQAAALRDGRKENSGHHRAPEISAEDRDQIIAHAVLKCGGRISQAWRELIASRQLSETVLSYYLANPASKSYVPETIRALVSHEVAMLEDMHHGPRTAKLNGAYLLRDWSAVAPMDWLCADDCTLEVYFYIPDGKGWFTLTRGQLLLMIDCRTTKILGYAMLPEKSYNARAIRTLITKIADEHGLPRQGFLFERGIWANSRLLKGDTSATPFSWGEAEGGLRDLGLKFKHSNLPRSKPVERVLGAFQDLMDGEPGFVGGNEMKQKFERVQKQKLLVAKPGGEHPEKYFYNLDQWIGRLDEFCAAYNAAPQDGKLLAGRSPDTAFETLERRDDPPIKLNAGCRYLLSHHKRPVQVTSNGITLRFGKQVYNYRNAETGRLIGQRVLSWFNPETPEILAVTDMNRENAFTAERTQEVPAMDAPADLLAQEMAKINAHNSYAKTRYRILQAKLSTPFRRTIADHATVILGTEMAIQRNQIETRQQAENKQLARTRKTARELGMNISPNAARRPETAPALERLNELLNED